MSSPQEERDRALSLLEPKMTRISKLYKECYLKHGKGALVAYADIIINGSTLSESDYQSKVDALDFFDNPKSHSDLESLIDKYNPKTEGILIIITSNSATWFVTAKLKTMSN